jgi:glycosyltransferase involved in cell wall biosynthesis
VSRQQKPIRVLHVGPGCGQRGGIASVVNELRLLSDVFSTRGVNLRFCETHSSKSLLGILGFFFMDIPRFMLQLAMGVDIVHLHVSVKGSFYRKFLLLLVARVLGRRLVFHLHAGNFSSFVQRGGKLISTAARMSLQGSDSVVGVSNAITDELVELGADHERVFVIGNNASEAERAFADAPMDSFQRANEPSQILFAGRLAATKGIDELLEAVALLIEQGVKAKLILAGSGDVTSWLNRAEQLKIRDHVECPGWLEGEAKLAALRSADIFCMPSHYESFGIATLEAMFAALPVVGTRVGGFLELVDDGGSGYLVDRSNVPALTRALKRLLVDPGLAAHMGRNGQLSARARFSSEAIATRYVKMYRRTLNSYDAYVL